MLSLNPSWFSLFVTKLHTHTHSHTTTASELSHCDLLGNCCPFIKFLLLNPYSIPFTYLSHKSASRLLLASLCILSFHHAFLTILSFCWLFPQKGFFNLNLTSVCISEHALHAYQACFRSQTKPNRIRNSFAKIKLFNPRRCELVTESALAWSRLFQSLPSHSV